MPIINEYFTLGGTAIEIAAPDNMPQQVWVHNAESSESTEAYIGGSSVGTSTGFHLHSGETMEIHLPPGDGLFGISGQGAPEVAVMRIQRKD